MPALGTISGLSALSSGPSGLSGGGESIITVASSRFGNPRHGFGSTISSLAGSGVSVPTATRPVGHQAQSVFSAACSLASDPATRAGLLSNILPWAPPGSLAINGVYVGEGLISTQNNAMGVCGDGGAVARILVPRQRGGDRVQTAHISST